MSISDGLVLLMKQRCDSCSDIWFPMWIGLSRALNLMSEGLFSFASQTPSSSL
jgi:hypothetical protein